MIRQIAGFFVYRHLGIKWCNIILMKPLGEENKLE